MTRVSHNEIVMFCRKALEGLGVSIGELEDAADAVGWLALHGIDGIAPFYDLLAELPYKPTFSPLPIEGALFDGDGKSALLFGPALLDFGFVQATLQNKITLKLNNCRHPLFLLAYMIRCASRGVHLAAWWREPAAQSEFIIGVAAGDEYPTIVQNEIENVVGNVVDGERVALQISSREVVDLTLYFDTYDPLVLDDLYAPQDLSRVRHEYAPAHFQTQHQHCIEQGIMVNAQTWTAIQEVGKLVLVEATEESRRRGAGENA